MHPAVVESRRRARRFLAALLALAAAACGDATGPGDGDLLERLNALPGVRAVEIQPYYGYARAFQLDITQPVDHHDPSGPTFTQRAYLSHADEDAPMVFGAYGYGATETSGEEMATFLQGNGLYVTHRYFPGSRPEPADWRYLDIWQAATDHHRIVGLLKEIYGGVWVSAGASKSGMTPLFHRRFYPDDVRATVAYVAPLMFSLGDPRFPPHVASLGTAEGRERIHAFQQRLLEHQDTLLPLFEAWFRRSGLELGIPAGPVFEGEVASYEWGFWQRHVYDYGQIPGPDAPHQVWIDHLGLVTRAHFASDTWRDYFKAYVYQLYTELGSPGQDLSHLEGLFRHEGLDPRDEYDFPAALPLDWDDGAAMRDVADWIRARGERIVLVYGGVDPWTGGAIDVGGNTSVLKVVQPGADHQVRILDLPQRDAVLAALSEWTGVPLTAVPAGALHVEAPERELAIRMGVLHTRLR